MIWTFVAGWARKAWPYLAGLMVLVGGWFIAKGQGKALGTAAEREQNLDRSLRVERDWSREQKHAEQQTSGLPSDALRRRAVERMRREQDCND